MGSNSRKKDIVNPEIQAPPKEEENICAEEEISCPDSCAAEDEENTTC